MIAYLQITVIGTLILLSLLSLSIIIERFIVIRKIQLDKKVKQKMRDSLKKGNLEEVRLISKLHQTKPFLSLVYQLLESKENEKNSDRNNSKKNLEQRTERELQTIFDKMEKRLSGLNTITLISPLLGLLGTVLGMIDSFFSLSRVSFIAEQSSKITLSLAGGISSALITTALGLIVTIPSIIFYNFFVKKISTSINEMSRDLEEIIENL